MRCSTSSASGENTVVKKQRRRSGIPQAGATRAAPDGSVSATLERRAMRPTGEHSLRSEASKGCFTTERQSPMRSTPPFGRELGFATECAVSTGRAQARSYRAWGPLGLLTRRTKKGGQWPPFPFIPASLACRPCPAPGRRLRGAEAAVWRPASASRPAGPVRDRP